MALSNPAFSRNPAFRPNNAAAVTTTETEPLATAEGIQSLYEAPAATSTDTGRMTYEDTIVKTVLLFAVILAAAAVGWFFPVLALPGAIAGLVLGLVNSFKRTPSPALILLYGAAQGLFIGGISAIFEQLWNGVVIQAVIATLAVFAVTLVLFASGKVREIYALEDDRLLLVASDRISTYDVVHPNGIPDKGKVLTGISVFWFNKTGHIVPNHYISATEGVPDAVRGRAMAVQRLEMLPVECVVRGYLTGSGWAEYRQSQSVCGVPLPAGLHNGDRLPEPIYTPAFKAEQGEHDENIIFERNVELVGEDAAARLREASLDVYTRASAIAEERGLILADTKFEFGTDPETGELTLADEVLTSDSSRYWDAEAWRTGTTPAERMASFDKQIVRDWLAANWAKEGTPPALPDDIVQRTAERYRELLERLTRD